MENMENGTKEKWGVAENLRANPIFVLFPFVAFYPFYKALFFGGCLAGEAKRHHSHMAIMRLNANIKL